MLLTCPHCLRAIDTDAPAKPSEDRLVLVPFGPTIVGAFLTVTVRAEPQAALRPRRLVIPPSIGKFFTLGDLKIGRVSEYSNVGEVSCDVFPPHPKGANPIENMLGLPVIELGQYVTLQVTNASGGVLTFSALMYAERV